MAAGLPHYAAQPDPGCTPIFITTIHWCAVGTVWSETRAHGGCSVVLTQVMANNCTRCDNCLNSLVNSEKCTAMLSILIQEIEDSFHTAKKKKKQKKTNKNPSVYVSYSIFRWYKYIICICSKEMYIIVIRYSTQKFEAGWNWHTLLLHATFDLTILICFSLHLKSNWNNPPEECYQEKSSAVNDTNPEEGKASSESNFYLEELEKYTFSVW